MGKPIGPKEAAARAIREEQYETNRRRERDTKVMLDQMKKLRGDIAAIPVKRAPKVKKP